MWPCVNTLSAVCVSRRRPPTCLWPDGSPKFVTIVLSVHQIVALGIVEITMLQKANQTQPLKNQPLYFENEAFLIKRFFSTLSWFRGLRGVVCPSFKIWPSTYRSYVVSTKNCPCTCPLKLLHLYRSYVVSTNNCPWTWPLKLFKLEKILAFPASQNPRPQLYFENVSFLQTRTVLSQLLWFGLSVFRGSVGFTKFKIEPRMIDRNDV